MPLSIAPHHPAAQDKQDSGRCKSIGAGTLAENLG